MKIVVRPAEPHSDPDIVVRRIDLMDPVGRIIADARLFALRSKPVGDKGLAHAAKLNLIYQTTVDLEDIENAVVLREDRYGRFWDVTDGIEELH